MAYRGLNQNPNGPRTQADVATDIGIRLGLKLDREQQRKFGLYVAKHGAQPVQAEAERAMISYDPLSEVTLEVYVMHELGKRTRRNSRWGSN